MTALLVEYLQLNVSSASVSYNKKLNDNVLYVITQLYDVISHVRILIFIFMLLIVTMSSEKLQEQKRVLNDYREFIIDNLEADDVIDELIQERLIGRSAAHRVQLMGMSRVEKNRIIVDQLCTAGPGAVEKLCDILRGNRRQSFIAEELEKCESQLQNESHHLHDVRS